MSTTEPIVQKQPAVQTNPFAKHLPDHVSAGAVAIESERAIAEAQGKLVIAKRFPRNQAVAYANIIDACKRPGLAEEACYSFPRGGQTVSGPSIRLAEMLAANWGNIDYGIRELSRKEGVSEMEAYCWDLETNTMSSQKFTVRHIRDKRGGNVALTDERDIYELTANMGGRRLRARILAILPADLIQAAVDECSKTLAGGNEVPLADRVRNMVAAFKGFGVAPDLIEKRLGHALSLVTPEELGDLRKIHNSIRDGVSKVGDWFGDGPKADDEQMEGDPVPTRPEPPKRAARGAAKVRENVQEADVVPPAPAPEAPKVEASAPTPEPAKATVQADGIPAGVHGDAAEADAVIARQGTPQPRAFLNDAEELTAVCEVVSVTGKEETKAGAHVGYFAEAKLTGGFVGVAYHRGGATKQGDTITPSAPWSVGAKLTLTLRGKKSAKGVVNVFVEKAEAVGEVEEF